jgi:hypothetical protein
MARKTIGAISVAKVYPMYVQKAERKGRSRVEVDDLIQWLTGYDAAGLAAQLERDIDFATFFAEAPAWNPASAQITGLICGYRVEEIEDETERKVRQLDKIIDELARGKALDRIKRA